MKNALGEEPYLESITCMFAIAVGTAPRPKPACPTVITAASKFLPMIRKVTKIPKRVISTICAPRITSIGKARSMSCQSFIVIMDSARKISREMLEIMDSSGSFRSILSVWSAIFRRIAAATMAPTEAGKSSPVFSSSADTSVPMPTVIRT